jgi:hypothetical protein
VPRDLSTIRRGALSLLRRALACPLDRHRDTALVVCGRFLYRCVDCKRDEPKGYVFVYGSNRVGGHVPWRAPSEGA